MMSHFIPGLRDTLRSTKATDGATATCACTPPSPTGISGQEGSTPTAACPSPSAWDTRLNLTVRGDQLIYELRPACCSALTTSSRSVHYDGRFHASLRGFVPERHHFMGE